MSIKGLYWYKIKFKSRLFTDDFRQKIGRFLTSRGKMFQNDL